MGGIRTGIQGTQTAARALTLSVIGMSMGIASPAFPAAASPLPSLCKAGERPLFQCTIGRKLAATCGTAAGAEYRFGRPGRVEIALRTLTRASRGYSGGGETQITATNKGYRYTLFDRVTRTSFNDDGRHDPAIASGLLVQRAGKKMHIRACLDEPVLSSQLTERLLSSGPFVEHP